MLNGGSCIELIKSISGYGKRRIYSLRNEYLKKGLDVFIVKARGIIRLLTLPQLSEIREVIKSKVPKDLGYHHNYWNTGILSQFIKDKYHVIYKSKTTYNLIFKDCKFSFHKPGMVYKKHDIIVEKKWIADNKQKIEEAWNDDQTIILCEDEMVLRSVTTFQKIWLLEGDYPLIEISNTRKNKSLYGFLNIKTGKQNVFSCEYQNMFITRKILYKINKIYEGKKILLLWDNPGWHRGSMVTNYTNKVKNIEILNFPPYCPDLNPQEHVWKAGRKNISHNEYIENIEKMTRKFVLYLNSNLFKYSLLGHGAI
jgi:transposase